MEQSKGFKKKIKQRQGFRTHTALEVTRKITLNTIMEMVFLLPFLVHDQF